MKLNKKNRRIVRKTSARIMKMQELSVIAKAEIASSASEISNETRFMIDKILA